MRWSKFYLHTTREIPADAEVISHQLMLRSGMIKKLAAGIYTYTPVGWRSISKLTQIVRAELEAAGSLELSMPAIQPAALWQESGRWGQYGRELLRMNDRHDREFCFGPTHEEVITDLVRSDVRSYKQLPFNLFQIQTKFRDEIRPRFGLMRGREFLMKDAYSFHADDDSLDETYVEMHAAYQRVFERCALDYTVVEADSGSIGGSSSHEFMVLAETGESGIVRCDQCGYAANVEKATIGALDRPALEDSARTDASFREVQTPGIKTIADLCAFLSVTPDQTVKTLFYTSETDEVVAVLIRGDRELNEIKLANYLGVQHLVLAANEMIETAFETQVGFAGPVGLAGRLIADTSVVGLENFVCGANRLDAHLVGVDWDRDVQGEVELTDLILAEDGDQCPRCTGTLRLSRGIEVGHIFKLGCKYSSKMGCNFLDQNGKSHPMTMGCYGLGIGRTVAAAIEQNHDDDGIVWPLPLAPFDVLVVALNPQDDEVMRVATEIYSELDQAGVDVLFDDRRERPGVKFKDADLVGFPIRVVIGKRGLAAGEAEISTRRDREKNSCRLDSVLEKVRELKAELAP